MIRIFKIVSRLTILQVVGFSVILNSYGQNSELEINFLDVGQGDSIIIKTPDNLNLLIDTGPYTMSLSEISENLPLLDKSIDIVVLTHADLDHSGGFEKVISSYEVGQVIVAHQNEKMQQILKSVDKKKISVVKKGDRLRIGCCVLAEVLWPNNIATQENDNSISLMITYKKFDFLLSGDLDSKFEDEIAAGIAREVDLLKISHHGSKNSTSKYLLEVLDPKAAVISVGENSYGHPSVNVLNNLSVSRIPTYLTNQQKNIEFSSDGRNLKFPKVEKN